LHNVDYSIAEESHLASLARKRLHSLLQQSTVKNAEKEKSGRTEAIVNVNPDEDKVTLQGVNIDVPQVETYSHYSELLLRLQTIHTNAISNKLHQHELLTDINKLSNGESLDSKPETMTQKVEVRKQIDKKTGSNKSPTLSPQSPQGSLPSLSPSGSDIDRMGFVLSSGSIPLDDNHSFQPPLPLIQNTSRLDDSAILQYPQLLPNDTLPPLDNINNFPTVSQPKIDKRDSSHSGSNITQQSIPSVDNRPSVESDVQALDNYYNALIRLFLENQIQENNTFNKVLNIMQATQSSRLLEVQHQLNLYDSITYVKRVNHKYKSLSNDILVQKTTKESLSGRSFCNSRHLLIEETISNVLYDSDVILKRILQNSRLEGGLSGIKTQQNMSRFQVENDENEIDGAVSQYELFLQQSRQTELILRHSFPQTNGFYTLPSFDHYNAIPYDQLNLEYVYSTSMRSSSKLVYENKTCPICSLSNYSKDNMSVMKGQDVKFNIPKYDHHSYGGKASASNESSPGGKLGQAPNSGLFSPSGIETTNPVHPAVDIANYFSFHHPTSQCYHSTIFSDQSPAENMYRLDISPRQFIALFGKKSLKKTYDNYTNSLQPDQLSNFSLKYRLSDSAQSTPCSTPSHMTTIAIDRLGLPIGLQGVHLWPSSI